MMPGNMGGGGQPMQVSQGTPPMTLGSTFSSPTPNDQNVPGSNSGMVSGQVGVTPVTAVTQQPQQPPKELNAATLCRFGQETVQEIISRSQEVFQTLKTVHPSDGKAGGTGILGADRKPKFQETIRNIKANFKRLRVIYEKIEEAFPSNTDMNLESSIPFKTESDFVADDPMKNTEAYRLAVEEHRETMEVMIRNRHLKETIDHLRQIIWDVNTMLAMRKE